MNSGNDGMAVSCLVLEIQLDFVSHQYLTIVIHLPIILMCFYKCYVILQMLCAFAFSIMFNPLIVSVFVVASNTNLLETRDKTAFTMNNKGEVVLSSVALVQRYTLLLLSRGRLKVLGGRFLRGGGVYQII